MDENGIKNPVARQSFRCLCLLSAKAVLKGQTSSKYPFNNDWVWWIRDKFLAGFDSLSALTSFPSQGYLHNAFSIYYQQGLLPNIITERQEAVTIWKEIVAMSSQTKMTNKADENYIKVSSQYGLLLQTIITEGW